MPRRSREETKHLLLDEGTRALLAEGLRGTGDIRLKDVCERLERRTGIRITAGSVYERIWDDQRDFQIEVLARALSEYDATEIVRAFASAIDEIDGVDPDDPAACSRAKSRFCRRVARELVEGILESRPWQLWVGAWGAVATTPELRDDHRVGSVIEAGYERATTALAEGFSSTLTTLGYEMRPGFDAYQLAVATGSLTEGLALRLRYDTDTTRELNTHLDAVHDDPWGLPGLCVEAIVDRFYQRNDPPNPRHVTGGAEESRP